MDIKKIIREELDNSLNWMGDIEPMKPEIMWLKDNFGNLTEVIKDGKVWYVDSERKPLFYHYQNQENGNIYINYWRIWSKLEEDFRLNDSEIQDVINEWLGEAYNLMGFTPAKKILTSIAGWERPII